MKTSRLLGIFGALGLCPMLTCAAVYNGNQVAMYPEETGYNYFDGGVGKGKLTLNDNAGTISATFNRGGPDPFQYGLIFFIDSVNGGINTTAALTPSGNYAEKSISGYSGANRSILNFASGFSADYAIVLNVSHAGMSGLYHIDSSTSFHKLHDITPNPANDVMAPAINFSWTWAEISGGGSTVNSLKFQSTYIEIDGYRSLESFETLVGSVGFSTINAAGYNVYTSAVPEPTNMALAVFAGCLGLGGLVKYRRTARRARLI